MCLQRFGGFRCDESANRARGTPAKTVGLRHTKRKPSSRKHPKNSLEERASRQGLTLASAVVGLITNLVVLFEILMR